MKPHLYINSKGYYVTRHSYSGSESFSFCARKYYLERVQGWSEKSQRSSTAFGIALEKGVTFWHQHGLDTEAAVAEFKRLWAEHKDAPFTYTKSDLDWDRLNMTGRELLILYTIRYPSFPYVVDSPLDFQVETNVEVFPGTKLAGITFTSYIDLLASIKGEHKPIIIDIKTSGKDVPEYTVMDPQLRSYSWVKEIPDVAFLWFRKMGRTVSRGDSITMLEAWGGMQPGDEAITLAKDIVGGWWVASQETYDSMAAQFIGDSKAVNTARQTFVEANGKVVPESSFTKQRVQFKAAVITPDSAEDIGRSIKRDIINISAANEKEFWPMQSGVRYPQEKCPNCAMRGICASRPEVRDALLVRKQLDEFDFGKEAE